MGGTLSENLKPTQKYSKANIKAVKESLKAQDFKEKYYKVIQDELIRKLGEYGYFSHTLFPDFGDYLGYLSKNFVDVSDDKKDESKIDPSKLSDD